ncbi:uncharacterized protein LOC115217028 isoform X10 [Argonauta hians]
MANQHMSADKELFLDILTKEEREALLTKKMEEIRKKNEALRKRHEEIEADKRQAEKMVKPTSPKKEIKSVDFKPVKKEELHRYSGSDFDYLKLRTDMEILSEMEVKRRPKPAARGKGPGSRVKERPKSLGPPPDPAYNFLADRRREGPGYDRDGGGGGGGGSSGSGGGGRGGGGGGGGAEGSFKDNRSRDMRRHPKNYGGTDFQNVKSKMKAARDRQSFNSTPPTKMEMSISMTGRERRQYMEWKAERDRVDKERIERQKSASGEWRREWDAEKHQQECNINQQFKLMQVSPTYEESVRRQEASRRPAGRIGSGRFDRGERDDRQRGEAPGMKAVASPAEVTELKRPSRIGEKADKGKKLLGRGRGRGRGITAPPRSRIIPANLASDSRKVECTRDLLVVKIDNAPGARDDVEVEYSDSDSVALRSAAAAAAAGGDGSGITSASIPISYDQASHSIVSSPYSKSCPTSGCAPAEKMWDTIQENSWDQSHMNGDRLHSDDEDDDDVDDDDEEGVMLEDEYIEDGELYGGIYEDAENETTNYGLVHGMPPGEEWEDGAEEDDYCVEEGQLAYGNSDKMQEALRLDCQLNPEAPAFVPTSPDFLSAPSELDHSAGANLASVEQSKESVDPSKNRGVHLPILRSSSAKEYSANTVDKDGVHQTKKETNNTPSPSHSSSSSSSSSTSKNSETKQNGCTYDSQKTDEDPAPATNTEGGSNCHDIHEDKPAAGDGDDVDKNNIKNDADGSDGDNDVDEDDDDDAKFEDSQESFGKSVSDSEKLVSDSVTNKSDSLDDTTPKCDSSASPSLEEKSVNQLEEDSDAKCTTETVSSEIDQISKADPLTKEINNEDDKDLKNNDIGNSKGVAPSNSDDIVNRETASTNNKDVDSTKVEPSNSEDIDNDKVVSTSKTVDSEVAAMPQTEEKNVKSLESESNSIVNDHKVDDDSVCKETVVGKQDNGGATSEDLAESNVPTKTSTTEEETAPAKEDVSVEAEENGLNVTRDSKPVTDNATKNNTFYPAEEICAVTIKETLQTVKDAGAWKLSVKDDIETVSVYKSPSYESNLSDSKTDSVAAEADSGISESASPSSSSSSSQNQLKETVSNATSDNSCEANNKHCTDLQNSSTDEKSKTESPDLLGDSSVPASNCV